jgi:poly(A) polymerase
MRAFGLPPSRRVGELRRALELAVEAGEVAPGQEAAVYIEFARSQPARFGLE